MSLSRCVKNHWLNSIASQKKESFQKRFHYRTLQSADKGVYVFLSGTKDELLDASGQNENIYTPQYKCLCAVCMDVPHL